MKKILVKIVPIIAFSFLVVSCSSIYGQDDLGRNNKFGAVVSDDTYSAYTGREIMRIGGNAVDAIIAMALVSNVSNPSRISMASAGRCLIWQPGTKQLIKVSTQLTSDARADLPMLQLILALYSKFGSLPWSELILPSEHTAIGGVFISKELLKDINETIFTDYNSKSYFIKKDKSEPQEGELIRIEPLAVVLAKLRNVNISPINLKSEADLNDASQFSAKKFDILNIISNFNSIINDDNSLNNKTKSSIEWNKYNQVFKLAGWEYFTSTDTSNSLSGLRHIWQLANNRKWLKNNWTLNQVELIQEEFLSNLTWKYLIDNNIDFSATQYIKKVNLSDKYNPSIIENISIKNENFKTIKFSAVDYFGLAVSCTFSLGKAFGTAKIYKTGGFFLPINADQAINESGEWFVIDLDNNKFIASFMAGNKESIYSTARATVRVMLTGKNLSKAFNIPRFNLSRDFKSVNYESNIDIKTYNELSNMGFNLVKKASLGSISGIFCPAGLPRDEKITICMAESDIGKSGNGYVRRQR